MNEHEPAKKKTEPREYVVLKHVNGEQPTWTEVDPGASIFATSSASAIRSCLESTAATSGAYVAIPLRSFKPVSVVVESKPSVQIGELA